MAVPGRPRLPLSALVLAAVTMAVSAAVLLTPMAGTRFGWYFDDLASLVAAAVATVCAIWRARTSTGRALRRSWTLVAIGCASWAVGEALWSVLELGQGRNPFPSYADIGYLGFPLAACAALLLYPAKGGLKGGGQRILDAVMATSALALISWETVLSAVMSGQTDANLTFGVSIAYPLTDLVVLALVVLTLVRTTSGRRTTTADELLIHADTAMYAAKRSGKDQIAIYREGMSLTELADDVLARAVAGAIENKVLRLAYQPIIDLTDGHISGLEALARWRHEGRDIAPDVFIPLAERTGLITELTAHVLREACQQVAEWTAVLGRPMPNVAVNVPPAEITARASWSWSPGWSAKTVCWPVRSPWRSPNLAPSTTSARRR